MPYQRSKLTLPAMLYEVSLTHPDRQALVWGPSGERWTYRHFAGEVMRAARGMAALGVAPGETVALWGSNSPQWLIAQWALAHLGAVWVPMDPGLEPEQAGYILEHCQAQAVVMADDMWSRFMAAPAAARPELAMAWPAGGEAPEAWTWEELMDQAREVGPGEMQSMVEAVKEGATTAIMYTSGTTGRPKGVRLSHKSLLAKCLAATERLAVGPADRLALFFPLHHMFGNTCIAMAGLCRAAALVMPGADFEPQAALEAMEAEECTALFGAPAMLGALLDDPSRASRELGSLRTGIVGGARCPLELMRRVVEEMGVGEMAMGYGITEASSWVSLSRPDDSLEQRTSTVGAPLKGTKVMIADADTGEELAEGQTGEVLVAGNLMQGYHRAPELTAQAVDAKGWLHTGDLGLIGPDGRLRLMGRIKEVMVRDGREIAPAAIEEALHGLAGVAEAAVFGVPHDQRGELVAAWVRAKPGFELDPDGLRRHLEAELPAELVPDIFKVVESFPTTASGKVQKAKLREVALAAM